MLKPCSQLSINQPLSDDLVIEILSRLPTKSLRRFLCVSKSWTSFINHLYLTKRIGILLPISGLFIHLEYPYDQFYVPITPESYAQRWESFYTVVCTIYDLHPIHSCNGLMLLTSVHNYVPIYYVCNFATMEYVHIDANKTDYCMYGSGRAFPASLPPAAEGDYYHPVFCFLAFNPCESPHYKVVRFSYKDNDNSGCILVQIYSSITRSWSTFTVSQVYPLCLDNWDQMAAFHKGALYIITHSGYLVRFQVDKASLQLLKLPHDFPSHYCPSTREGRIWMPHSASCIGDSRGNLYYAVNTSMEELHIYMLDDVQGVWWLMHRMTTCQLTLDFDFSYFQPIAIHPESGMIYLCTDNGIFSCDPIKSRLEKLSNFCPRDETEDVYWKMVFPVMHYLESIHVSMKPLPMQCCL